MSFYILGNPRLVGLTGIGKKKKFNLHGGFDVAMWATCLHESILAMFFSLLQHAKTREIVRSAGKAPEIVHFDIFPKNEYGEAIIYCFYFFPY